MPEWLSAIRTSTVSAAASPIRVPRPMYGLPTAADTRSISLTAAPTEGGRMR